MSFSFPRSAEPESKPNAASNGRTWLYLAVCLALSVGWLMAVNFPTLGENYVDEFFRIGMKPWSDAYAWTDGAEELLAGQTLTSVGARRPLYPLFLAGLTRLTGPGYFSIAGLQFLLTAVCFGVVAWLLRPVRHRFAATALLALLLIWRPEGVSVFMTETLALPLLALSFAAFWRGAASPFMSSSCSTSPGS